MSSFCFPAIVSTLELIICLCVCSCVKWIVLVLRVCQRGHSAKQEVYDLIVCMCVWNVIFKRNVASYNAGGTVKNLESSCKVDGGIEGLCNLIERLSVFFPRGKKQRYWQVIRSASNERNVHNLKRKQSIKARQDMRRLKRRERVPSLFKNSILLFSRATLLRLIRAIYGN